MRIKNKNLPYSQTHGANDLFRTQNPSVEARPTMSTSARDKGRQDGISNFGDETDSGSGMNWDHYAQCRLQDFEQR